MRSPPTPFVTWHIRGGVTSLQYIKQLIIQIVVFLMLQAFPTKRVAQVPCRGILPANFGKQGLNKQPGCKRCVLQAHKAFLMTPLLRALHVPTCADPKKHHRAWHSSEGAAELNVLLNPGRAGLSLAWPGYLCS